jgi:hypothetical protein
VRQGSKKKAGSFRPRPAWAAALLALLLALPFAVSASGPVYLGDEVGYAGNAAFLSGTDRWQLQGGSFAVGWSLLLAPLWWFSASPESWYRASIGLNLIIGAGVAGVTQHLLRRLGVPVRTATVAALALALAPGRTIFYGYVLAEHLLVLLFTSLVLLLVIHWSGVDRDLFPLGALGLSGFLPLFHVRLLPVPVLMGLFLLAAAVRQRQAKPAIHALLLAALVVFSITCNVILEETLYPESSRASLIGSVDTGSALVAIRLALGQLWYGAAAWMILPLLGAWSLIFGRVRGRLKPSAAAPHLLVAMLIGLYALSVLYLTPFAQRAETARSDFFIYGRYNEAVWLLLSLFAIVELEARARNFRRDVGVVVGFATLTAGTVLLVTPRPVNNNNFVRINAPGVEQWPLLRDGLLTLPLREAALLAVVVYISLTLLLRVAPRPYQRLSVIAGLSLVGVVFGASSIAVRQEQLDAIDEPYRERLLSLRHVPAMANIEPLYLLGGHKPESANGYQFYVSADVLEASASELQQIRDKLIIGRRDWNGAVQCGCMLILEDPYWDDALYVARGDLQLELRARGWLQSVDATGPYPPSAYEAGVTLGRTTTSDNGPTVQKVLVRHAGGGHPWRARAVDEDALGTVRVVAWWDPEGVREPTVVDLPRSVVPGEEFSAAVPLSPPADFRPGRYLVGIGLVHEGIRSFAPPGEEPVRLLVDVGTDGRVSIVTSAGRPA